MSMKFFVTKLKIAHFEQDALKSFEKIDFNEKIEKLSNLYFIVKNNNIDLLIKSFKSHHFQSIFDNTEKSILEKNAYLIFNYIFSPEGTWSKSDVDKVFNSGCAVHLTPLQVDGCLKKADDLLKTFMDEQSEALIENFRNSLLDLKEIIQAKNEQKEIFQSITTKMSSKTRTL